MSKVIADIAIWSYLRTAYIQSWIGRLVTVSLKRILCSL